VSRSVAVTTAADSAFAWPAALALLSAVAHAGNRIEHLILIDCGIAPQETARIRALLESCNRELVVRRAHLPRELQDYEFTSHLSSATFARVFAPRYAAEFSARTLYVDADSLTIGPISPLLDIRMDSMIVAAVADNITSVSSAGGVGGWRRLGLEPTLPMFNAGVLLIDNQGWLAENVEERVVSELVDFPEDATYGDQGALNAALAGHWRVVDRVWNYRVRSSPGIGFGGMFATRRQIGHLRSIRILHFLGERKPWQAVYPPSPLRELYRREWARIGNPPLGDPFGYIDWMRWKFRRSRGRSKVVTSASAE
jgi:lipopolysaccharide biosynthesis glycosyltransferase